MKKIKVSSTWMKQLLLVIVAVSTMLSSALGQNHNPPGEDPLTADLTVEYSGYTVTNPSCSQMAMDFENEESDSIQVTIDIVPSREDDDRITWEVRSQDGTVIDTGDNTGVSEATYTVNQPDGALEDHVEAVCIFEDEDGNIEEVVTNTITLYEPSPTPPIPLSLSIEPLQELLSPRYRKIALNGRPLSDERPEAEAETDEAKEQTYVDALTLTLSHSTTDFYFPVGGGSDLAISLRRDSVPVQYTSKSSQRPEFQQVNPFGAGWKSNIAAHIDFNTFQTSSITSGSGGSECAPPWSGTSPQYNGSYESYISVLDENGASFRFIADYSGAVVGFRPFPSGSHEVENYQATLEFYQDGYLLTKKHGTKCYYEQMSDVRLNLTFFGYSAESAVTTNIIQDHQYSRLTRVEDRFGNAIIYEYSGSSMIPSAIYDENAPDTRLDIFQSGGKIKSVTDGNGNKCEYTYSTLATGFSDPGYQRQAVPPVDPDVVVLGTVTRPDQGAIQYSYESYTEPDETPIPLRGASEPLGFIVPTPFFHINLKTITDPNNNKHTFHYSRDTSKERFVSNDDGAWTYVVSGQPRYINRVSLPAGAGSTNFTKIDTGRLVFQDDLESGALIGNVPGNLPGSRSNRVQDTEGNHTTYTFSGTQILPIITNRQQTPSPNSIEIPPRFICLDMMSVQYQDSNNSTLGTETFSFDCNKALALSSINDFSGNTTTFDYTDPLPSDNVISYDSGAGVIKILGGFYTDPNSETNALNDTKTYTYDANFRIMDNIVDEEGRTTSYVINSLGLRTKETIAEANGAIQQVTDYEYTDSTFPGFMTKKTVTNFGKSGDPAWVAPLVTQYEPDSNGRVWKETVDPGGLNLTTIMTYDDNGNKVMEQDPRGNTTNFEYDEMNRLVKVIYPSTDGGGSRAEKVMTYDLNGNKMGEKDENGHWTVFKYDGLNRPTDQIRVMNDGTVDPATYLAQAADLVTEYEYNNVNSKTAVIDPRGNKTEYEFDALQRMFEMKTPSVPVNGGANDQLVTTYDYDIAKNTGAGVFHSAGFKPTTVTDPRGVETVVTYDKLYRPVTESVEYDTDDFSITSKEYDDVGNLTILTDPLGNITQTAYDALNRPTQVVEASGSSDAQLITMAYTATGLQHQMSEEVIAGVFRVTDTEYDLAGRPIKVIQPTVTGGRPETETHYDANGNVTKTINPLDNEWDFQYDSRNRKTHEFQPSVADAENGGSSRPTIITGYDGVGNVTSVQDARGNTTTTEYDNANRPDKVTAPSVSIAGGGSGNPVTETTYDPNGNILTIEDPNDNVTTNTYDALNRLITTTDAESILVTNEYDEVGNRTAVIDGELRRTVFEYDGLNRNTKITYGAGSAEAYSEIFSFDAINKIKRQDGNNQLTHYQYDARNRLIQASYGATPGAINTATNATRDYTYDLVGNLVAVTEAAKGGKANIAYGYDGLNRVVAENQGAAHGTLSPQANALPSGITGGETHTYVYDNAGNRTLHTTSTGRVIDSDYDDLNRLLSMTENPLTDNRVTNYTYDLNGNIVTKELPNGDLCTNVYDALNRKTSMSGTNGVNALYTYTYSYDLLGNVLQIAEDYPSTSAAVTDRIVTNTYDDIYRLREEITYDPGAVDVEEEYKQEEITSYTYDDSHNRLSLMKKTRTSDSGTATYSNQSTKNYQYNNLNQLDGYTKSVAGEDDVVIEYDYDNNGNRTIEKLINDDGPDLFRAQLSFDTENRLVSLTKSGISGGTYSYTYDYRTRRVERDESGIQNLNGTALAGKLTTIIFSGGTSCHEEEGGNVTVEYIRGSDYGGGVGGVLYTLRDVAGTLTPSYTHNNHRGDIVAKTDDTGSLTYQAAYEAFGSRTEEEGTTDDRQKANSKDEDPTGLLNEGFRYRDLETGTFITRDPAGFVDGPNLYTYVVQNPWTTFDPQGLADARKYTTTRRRMMAAQNARFGAQLKAAPSAFAESATYKMAWGAGIGAKAKLGPIEGNASIKLTAIEGKNNLSGSKEVLRQGVTAGLSAKFFSKVKVGLEYDVSGGYEYDAEGNSTLVNTNDSVLGVDLTPGKGSSLDNETIAASAKLLIVELGAGIDFETMFDQMSSAGDVAAEEALREFDANNNFSKNQTEANQTPRDPLPTESSRRTMDQTNRDLGNKTESGQKPTPPVKKDEDDE